MNPTIPYVDSPIKREIIAACEIGRTSNDWNPLLKVMNHALSEGAIDGPFFFHARMVIDIQDVYNYCILEIDNANVKWMRAYLTSVGGFEAVQRRYEAYFKQVPPFPIHFPAQILAANPEGNAGAPSTVAWFLHEHLPGIRKDSLDFICGIEIASSWQLRFDEIYYPGGEATLDVESLTKLRALEHNIPFNAATTLYATIHDAGHWLGTQACLPAAPDFAAYMPAQFYAAMGELVTDMAAIGLMIDTFPSVTATILNMRLFDYAHYTPGADPLVAALNHQFDTLANATLFMYFLKTGVLSQVSEESAPEGARWHLDFEKLPSAALALATELEALGSELLDLLGRGETAALEPRARQWYAQYIEVTPDQEWAYPAAIQPFLRKLQANTDLTLTMERMLKRFPLQAELPMPETN